MSAAFEVYRAFRADREAFQEHMVSHDKLKMPVLTIAWEDALIADVSHGPPFSSYLDRESTFG